MKPVPGSIVHFVTERGEHRPAIVISVYEKPDTWIEAVEGSWRWPCNLQVFFDWTDGISNPAYDARNGFMDTVDLDQPTNCDEDSESRRLESNTWHWPSYAISGMDPIHGVLSETISSGAAKPVSSTGEKSAQSGPRTTGGKK